MNNIKNEYLNYRQKLIYFCCHQTKITNKINYFRITSILLTKIIPK